MLIGWRPTTGSTTRSDGGKVGLLSTKVEPDDPRIQIDAYIRHGVRLCRVDAVSPAQMLWLEDVYTLKRFQASKAVVVEQYELVRAAPALTVDSL